jgi:hypothetical protein
MSTRKLKVFLKIEGTKVQPNIKNEGVNRLILL